MVKATGSKRDHAGCPDLRLGKSHLGGLTTALPPRVRILFRPPLKTSLDQSFEDWSRLGLVSIKVHAGNLALPEIVAQHGEVPRHFI